MIIEKNKIIDLVNLGDALVPWFIERDWETKTNKSDKYYTISAKKTNELRKLFCANRALSVVCYHEGGTTKIKIVQGDWTDNLVGNIGWFIVTGGAWGAMSLWSIQVQRQFKRYAEEVLNRF